MSHSPHVHFMIRDQKTQAASIRCNQKIAHPLHSPEFKDKIPSMTEDANAVTCGHCINLMPLEKLIPTE